MHSSFLSSFAQPHFLLRFVHGEHQLFVPFPLLRSILLCVCVSVD